MGILKSSSRGAITSPVSVWSGRYSVVIAFIAAAVLTPPDPVSQLTLAIPIILLYEISIICARMIQRQRKAAEEAADAAE